MSDHKKCAYRNCGNTYTDKPVFHFPVSDKRRRMIWIKNSGNNSLNSLTLGALAVRFICVEHFSDHYIMGKDGRIRLVENAVPVHYKTVAIEPGDDPSLNKIPHKNSTTEDNSGQGDTYLKCAYRNCQNTYIDKAVFHFPVSDKKRVEIWIANSGNNYLNDLTPIALRQQVICAEHFPEDHILGRNSKIRLVEHAVPVHHITRDVEREESKTDISEVENVRYRKAFIKPSGKCLIKALVNHTDESKNSHKKTLEAKGSVPIACKRAAEDQNGSEETQKKIIIPNEQEDTVVTSFLNYARGILPKLPPWRQVKAINEMLAILPKYTLETGGLNTQEDLPDSPTVCGRLTGVDSQNCSLEDSKDPMSFGCATDCAPSHTFFLANESDLDIKPRINVKLEPVIKTEPGLSKAPEAEFVMPIEEVKIKSEAEEVIVKSEPEDVQVKIEDET